MKVIVYYTTEFGIYNKVMKVKKIPQFVKKFNIVRVKTKKK